MTISLFCHLGVLLAAMFVTQTTTAEKTTTTPKKAEASTAESPAKKAASPTADVVKYGLRYKFRPGETLRWEVVYRGRVRAIYGGWTRTTDTSTRSTQCWRILEVDSEGNAVFENLVEDAVFDNSIETVDAKRKTQRDESHYDSRKDAKPPKMFEIAAGRFGKPLARVKIDTQGHTLQRTALLPEPASDEKPELTIPLPANPVAVGDTWRRQQKVLLPLENKATKTILVEKVFKLTDVRTGVATIEVANQVLTPIHSPEIEAKLINRYARGTVRLDIDSGRILSQQMDLDRRVVGFQGADSCVQHLTRSTQTLLPDTAAVARRTGQAK